LEKILTRESIKPDLEKGQNNKEKRYFFSPPPPHTHTHTHTI